MSVSPRLWPGRRRPGDHDRLKPFAEAVVDHLALCDVRCVQKAPEHGKPHLLGATRPGGEDDTGGA